MKKKLVLIGNGMAGVNVIEHLLKLNADRYDITIFGEEPHPNYNRVMLSKVLAGDVSMDTIILNNDDWYVENDITLYKGEKVTQIDSEAKTVVSSTGKVVPYDDLIIATGSSAFMLPLPGVEKDGVIGFRDMQDCETMKKAAKTYKKAAVIGGGLLGLEAARGILNLGMEVDVIHLGPHLMERQLDPTASHMLQQALEQQGMNFLLQKQSSEILGGERATGLRFQDGTSIDADLIVMAVGIKPNVQLGREAGLHVGRGIVVNDVLETSIPHIYAVGECAEHRGISYGLVAPLFEQGAVLAKKLAGTETAPYEGSLVYSKLKVSGVDVFSIGEFMEQDDVQGITIHDAYSGVYKKVMIRDEKVVGAILYGDSSDSTRLLSFIKNETNIADLKKTDLLTNVDGGTESVGVAHMSDDEIICGCNGVSKGDICQAIKEQQLQSVEEVKKVTSASGSCGGCRPQVSELLTLTLGNDYDSSKEKTKMCSCTDYSRDEILEVIKDKQLTYVREVMHVLEWKTEEGCSKCRPALNYYLGMIYPKQYEDDATSRFVNERMHANIQKDGTFSVVPRIYGGVTTPAALKKIAEVAEKYHIPTVKVTGGQRIDLLGVKKEDLTNVWEELDMASGYAYGKALRTVKTCVGDTYCRFGTADAMGLGIHLEKYFERLETPAKVKMAVSGCPRNCAESGIKDVGVVAIDGGFELYVGGNGGVNVRAGDHLVTVKTEAEVVETIAAYLQHYRETAHYGERTSTWVERFGLAAIQEVLENKEERERLLLAMQQALSQYKDPWKKVIESKEKQKHWYEVVSVPE
ncbi:nitrite reductase large subunit NirB [Longirhabdus pacifica]|uniref:nitrite reductase large subunit NirB n=1 Tax=Longirhabdus pacifica TaxID=2305227 RepID=UPI0010092635